ncbi:DDE-type integrase/transposase/recombinase [Amphritea pacifica]|uniref:DDE-type integrase/transposase/recombinase n=1 Tax=Amphritea pacifica TaxID=2811233 RepID=A0ABS2WCB6_9GAMM|nr:DDE-type integrase/transposase/recombinase [Amphritea pacifica]MBN0989365.1 DDE-type integrase/transposase/recombinase [Amphritea pacifica]
MPHSIKPLMLETGTRFSWNGQDGEIYLADANVYLVKFENNRFESFEPRTFYDAYVSGAIRLIDKRKSPIIYQPITTDSQAQELNRLSTYLVRLDREEFPNSKKSRIDVIKIVGDMLGETKEQRFKEMTLYRRYQKWIKAGRNILVFAENHRKRRESKFSQEVLDLIEEVIHDEYLKKDGPSPHACYHILQRHYEQRELPGKCIQKSRFYELINEQDKLEVTLARKGREAARKMAQYTEEMIFAEFPLQYIEIDAVHINIGVLCEETDQYLGTLIVYVAIDRFTRCVIGYSTSIKGKGRGERADAVIACIKHSALPKADVEHTDNSWNCFGVPYYVICDAGSAFNNADVAAFIGQMGASRVITKTKNPKKKPFIERFFRTFREQLAKRMPGYVGKRMDGDEIEITVAKSACMHLSEIHQAIDKYIVDFYQQSGHKGLDMQSPAKVWDDFESENGPRRLPANMAQMDTFIGTGFNGKIQAGNGIQKNNLMYNSKELRDLYFELKNSQKSQNSPGVRCSYNRQDISQIAVTNPRTMQMFLVPCTNKRIKPGTSLEKYQASKASDKPKAAKTYMSANELVFEKAKQRQKERTRKNNRQKDSNLEPAQHQTSEYLEQMLHNGKGRFAEAVSAEPASQPEPYTDDDSIEFDNLPDVDVE